jgi:myo-inositol 2-dehydrogenase/D-chiro-inositol 1-dehydrogenase
VLEYKIEGEKPWSYDGPDKKNLAKMYDLEHQELFNSIRDGKPINNGHYMANSTMLAVMGRMCTYTGLALTWDQCFNSQQRLGPSEYDWNDNVPEVKVAIPGRTKFV